MDSLFYDALVRLLRDSDALDKREDRSGFKADVWPLWETSGLMDLFVPEALGGAGLDLPDAGKLLVAIGEHGAGDTPLAATMLIRSWLCEVGVEPPQGTITFSGGASFVDKQSLCVLQVVRPDLADWIFVTLPDGSARLLPMDAAERESGRFQASFLETLVFSSTVVAEATPIAATLPTSREGAALVASCLIAGLAQRVLTDSVAYTHERKQFGRSLAKFQAIQHQLSVMTELSWAASMAAELACQSDSVFPDTLLVGVAKARTTDIAVQVADTSHAVHGAIGITEEFSLQKFTRTLRALSHQAGGAEYWDKKTGSTLLAQKPESMLSFMVDVMGT